MQAKSKALIAVPVSLAMLFFSNGIASNVIYHNIESYMLRSARKTTCNSNAPLRFYCGQLTGYAAAPDRDRPHRTMIYFCGAGENARSSVMKYHSIFPDFTFLCVDYPGTNDSRGKLNLKQLKRSALAVYDHAVKLPFVDKRHIYSLGYSYGTGMATYLAARRKCTGLVLVAPYRDSSDMVRSKIKIPSALFKWALTDVIKTSDYAKNVTKEALLITSDNDKLLNSRLAFSLSSEFKHSAVAEFSGISHGDYFSSGDVVKSIRDFCSK